MSRESIVMINSAVSPTGTSWVIFFIGNYILQNAQNARNMQNNNCPLLRCGGKTPETNKCFINERYTSYNYLIGFIDFAYNLVWSGLGLLGSNQASVLWCKNLILKNLCATCALLLANIHVQWYQSNIDGIDSKKYRQSNVVHRLLIHSPMNKP